MRLLLLMTLRKEVLPNQLFQILIHSFLDSTLIAELKAELANYTAAAVECQLS